MFNFMLKHKKGFTLVELIVVMALMGFGVVALANLFQTAYRSFNKAEERYIKQEMVKSVAEYLQTSISIGAATKAEIYPDTSVVPLKAGEDLSYHYVYAEKSKNLDGYYLYKLERGQAKSQAVCINPETPLYITFSAYQDEDYVGSGEIKNQCGIKVRIAAVDNSFQYKDDSYYTEGKTEAAEIEDYIFFDTVVSYHFPNMVTKSDTVRVNFTHNVRDKANAFAKNGDKVDVTGVVDSCDLDGKVLRITSDTTLSTDAATAAISVASFCFIATAGYGEATGEVGILCDFRDQCLKTNPLGRMFVQTYYAVSPPIADFISEHEPLKAAVRVALKPLVVFAVYALEPELLIEELPFVIIGIGSLGGIVAVAVVRRRKLIIES